MENELIANLVAGSALFIIIEAFQLLTRGPKPMQEAIKAKGFEIKKWSPLIIIFTFIALVVIAAPLAEYQKKPKVLGSNLPTDIDTTSQAYRDSLESIAGSDSNAMIMIDTSFSKMMADPNSSKMMEEDTQMSRYESREMKRSGMEQEAAERAAETLDRFYFTNEVLRNQLSQYQMELTSVLAKGKLTSTAKSTIMKAWILIDEEKELVDNIIFKQKEIPKLSDEMR